MSCLSLSNSAWSTRRVAALAGEGARFRISPGSWRIEVPLSEESRYVASLLQQRNEGRLTGPQPAAQTPHSTGAAIAARQQTSPAGTAHRSRDKGVRESHAQAGQRVHGRSADHRAAGTAHGIPPLVVGQNEQEIRPSPAAGEQERGGAHKLSPGRPGTSEERHRRSRKRA